MDVLRWCIAVLERPGSFSQQYINNVVKGLNDAARSLGKPTCSQRYSQSFMKLVPVGLRFLEQDPVIDYINHQGDVTSVNNVLHRCH